MEKEKAPDLGQILVRLERLEKSYAKQEAEVERITTTILRFVEFSKKNAHVEIRSLEDAYSYGDKVEAFLGDLQLSQA